MPRYSLALDIHIETTYLLGNADLCIQQYIDMYTRLDYLGKWLHLNSYAVHNCSL